MSNSRGAEQPGRDSAPVTTQHQSIPDATGGLGLQNYFLKQVQGATAPAPDPADGGGQPAEPIARESQRGVEPAPSEHPDPRSADPDSIEDLDEVAEMDDEQPDEDEGEGLVVDGQRFTPERIRELIAEQEKAGLRQDDYTRKSQYLSRVRQEHEALGERLEGLAETFRAKEQLLGSVVNANLAQFDQIDTSRMNGEQFEEFKRQRAAAQQGAEFLISKFNEVDQQIAAHQTEAMKKRARATKEMLRWAEPRWDDQNQFYGKLREFTVREGLMSEEAFDRETDFLRMRGLIAIMDAHEAPDVIDEAANERRPPRRSRNRARNNQGQFQRAGESARQAVRESKNAKADGSLRAMLQANLLAEGDKRQR
jgi:hypothetical protein